MLTFILLVLLAIAHLKIFYLRSTVERLYEVTLHQHYENLKRDPLAAEFSGLDADQKLELFKTATEAFKSENFELFWRACNVSENADKNFLDLVSRLDLQQTDALSALMQEIKLKKCVRAEEKKGKVSK